MTEEQPDLTAFQKDDRPGEYEVFIAVSGTIRETVKAESEAEARAMANAMIEAGDLELYADDFDEVGVDSVRKSPPMYLVSRNGTPMRVSRVQSGDLPREPLERGF